MKKRRNKFLGILLVVSLMLQGMMFPVYAESTDNPDDLDTASTDTGETSPSLVAAQLDEVNETEGQIDETGEPQPAETSANLPDTSEEPPATEPASTESEVSSPTEPTPVESEAPAPKPTEAPAAAPPASEPAETEAPKPTEDPKPTEEPSAGLEAGGLSETNPLIGPMFIGLNLLMPNSMFARTASDSGMELLKTATYIPTTNSVDFQFDIFSTGELVTTESQKPVDIILVLDQSGSMANTFGNGTKHTIFTPSGYGNSGKHSNLFSNRGSLYVMINWMYYKVTITQSDSNYTYSVADHPTMTVTLSQNSAVPAWAFYTRHTNM